MLSSFDALYLWIICIFSLVIFHFVRLCECLSLIFFLLLFLLPFHLFLPNILYLPTPILHKIFLECFYAILCHPILHTIHTKNIFKKANIFYSLGVISCVVFPCEYIQWNYTWHEHCGWNKTKRKKTIDMRIIKS